jgi:hypothetical protein
MNIPTMKMKTAGRKNHFAPVTGPEFDGQRQSAFENREGGRFRM